MTAWLMTYFLHSSILIGTAALLSRALDDRWLPLKESLWRVAVFGGLVTATLQVGLAVQPLGGSWNLGAEIGTTGVVTASAIDASAAAASATTPVSPSTSPSWIFAALRRGESLATGAWLLGAVVLTLVLLTAFLRLENQLRDRRRLEDGPLFGMLSGLLQRSEVRSGVALTSSPRTAVPLAKGWWRREICLPERVTTQLKAEQQETILAHELAHLERHDPLWLFLLRLLESVMFFQPCNRLARRQLQEIAEYRCDDWAVEKTGRPLTMARCLANVAEWSLRKQGSLPAPALASNNSSLKRRVSRLLDRGYPLPHRRRPGWLLPLASVLLLVTVLVAPGFSVAEPESPATVEPVEQPAPVDEPVPVAPQEPEAPEAPDVEPVTVVEPAAPVAPVEPVPPAALLEASRHELEAVRESMEAELHEIHERLEAAVLAVERSLIEELERVERIPLAELEALEPELEGRIELHRLELEKAQELHRELRQRFERERQLREVEMLQFREEQIQRQHELRERLREDTQEDEPPPS